MSLTKESYAVTTYPVLWNISASPEREFLIVPMWTAITRLEPVYGSVGFDRFTG